MDARLIDSVLERKKRRLKELLDEIKILEDKKVHFYLDLMKKRC